MKIEQIYTGCLAQGAYYITSNGEAAIIDPLRETAPYLERLKKDDVVLKYIFETHFHADFVSGHVDLSQKTGAIIVYGPSANPDFQALIATDGQLFEIGNIKIKAIHTPGHTLESTTYLLLDENDKEQCIFSGDTLFLGDVGRPDLAQKANEITQEDLAGMLYDSLYNKIMPLPNNIIVYPAHGAGSACGKKMMSETQDTLGNQKSMNYALNQPNKEAFIVAVLDGLTPPPAYFKHNVALNKKGYEGFDTVLNKGLNPLTLAGFDEITEDKTILILDTRPPAEFYKGFVPGSINIGLNGDFAPWAGNLITDPKQKIVLVTELGKEEETITRLSRVGFDNVSGFLDGGVEAWKKERDLDVINRITPFEFESQIKNEGGKVIDVRGRGEFEKAHLKVAENLVLNNINEWIGAIDKNKNFFIHCAGGYRSMIAASILQARGIRNFYEVEGGYNAIAATNLEKIVDTGCTI